MNGSGNRLFHLLQGIFGPLDAILESIPFGAARWIVVGFLVIAALSPMLLSDAYIYAGSADRSRRRDLRLWALLIMLPYILIYMLF